MLDRQQADLKERIHKKEVLEDKALEKKEAVRWYMLEHWAYIQRLCKTLELNCFRSIAKTYEEIVAQDKKIEE